MRLLTSPRLFTLAHTTAAALRLGTTVALLLLGGFTAAQAQDAFFTTGTTNINYSINGNAYVGEDSSFNSSDPTTHQPYNPTVNLVPGGSIGQSLYAYNNSQVNVTGGSIFSSLIAYNSSQVSVTGGSIGIDLSAADSSQVSITGGTFGQSLYAYDSSQVSVSGGTFGQYQFGQSLGVNFFDGTKGSFALIGSNLMATLIGADATFDGTDYALSGTLQSGTSLSGYVLNVASRATFTLVPEPGTWSLLAGLGLTGAGVWRKRRACRP